MSELRGPTALKSNGLTNSNIPSEHRLTKQKFDRFLKRLKEEFKDIEDRLRRSRWKTERCEEHTAHILGHLLYDRMNPLGETIYTNRTISGRYPDIVHLTNNTELGQEAAVEIVVTNEPSIEKIRVLNAAGLPVFGLFWEGDPKQKRFEKKVRKKLDLNQPVRTGVISLRYSGWTNPGDPISYNNERKIEPTENLSASEFFRRNVVPAYIEASGRVQQMTDVAAGFYRVSGLQVWNERHPIIHVDGFGKSSNIEIFSISDGGWTSLSPEQIIKSIKAGKCKEIWPAHGIQWPDREALEGDINIKNTKRTRRLTPEEQSLRGEVTERLEELPDNNRELIS